MRRWSFRSARFETENGLYFFVLTVSWENPMQDLIKSYVSDLHKLREVFHKELEATAEELSKAMALYAKRCDAALASFMEKASARESELKIVSGGKA